MSGKGFLGNMTENLQADCVQSRQAGFMQRFLNDEWGKITPKDTCQASCQHPLVYDFSPRMFLMEFPGRFHFFKYVI